MLCSRCNLNEVEKGLCNICKLSVMMGEPKEEATDDEIIEHYTVNRLFLGCRECGGATFGYDAGTYSENNLKWFIMKISCSCGAKYDDILEVRVENEPNKNNKKTHTK